MSVQKSKQTSLVNAINRLEDAILHQRQEGITSDLLRDAIIQRFEFTLEVTWKYMRFLLLDEGILREDVASPKKTIQTAYANGLINDGGIWLEMIVFRNTLSHVYDEKEAIVLENKIRNEYLQVFKLFIEKITEGS